MPIRRSKRPIGSPGSQALYHTGLKALDRGVPIERVDLGPAQRALAAARRASGGAFAERAAAAEAAIRDLAP